MLDEVFSHIHVHLQSDSQFDYRASFTGLLGDISCSMSHCSCTAPPFISGIEISRILIGSRLMGIRSQPGVIQSRIHNPPYICPICVRATSISCRERIDSFIDPLYNRIICTAGILSTRCYIPMFREIEPRIILYISKTVQLFFRIRYQAG